MEYATSAETKIPGYGGRSQEQISTRLEGYLIEQEGHGFSGVVLIAKGDAVLLKQGFGSANREARVPYSTNTVFTVGSITKQFTGAAIAKLAEDGKLALDDTIDQFFENVPEDKRSITLHHLLTHTSGMVGGFGGDFDSRATKQWMLNRALHSKLRFAPGAKHRYSNAGYSLLGIVIEEVSGQPYETYLRDHLFTVAGMTDTGYLLPGYETEKLAVAYKGLRRWGTVLERAMLSDGPCWNLRANGGIHSTIDDILKWHLALKSDRILSAESKRQYFAPHADEGGGNSFYGYGWVNWVTPWKTRLLSHNGGNGFFAADFHRYVDDDVLIFVATNADIKAWNLMDTLESITFDCD